METDKKKSAECSNSISGGSAKLFVAGGQINMESDTGCSWSASYDDEEPWCVKHGAITRLGPMLAKAIVLGIRSITVEVFNP